MTDQAMRAFLDSCGSSGPLIIGVEEPGASGTSWRVLDQPYAIIGRDPGTDLFLQDADVSRRHAYLQMIAGRLFCIDLESRTGTHWGEEPGLWGWVHPGPGVRIGAFRLRSRDEGPGPPPNGKAGRANLPVPVSRSFEQPELPEVTLEILGRRAGPATWRASRSLILIGGSQACKVRLQGRGVAEIHASLVRTPAGVFAVDLLGPGGILVNGERVRCALLGEDDELGVGSHRIRVTSKSAKGEATRAISRPASPRGWIHRPPTTSVDGSSELAAIAAGERDTESLVRAMIGEFGQIQERSAERFQATLMAILQSFAGIHGEQMVLIREELTRIRELTDEQQALRSQVESRARIVENPPALRLVAGEPRSATLNLAPNSPNPARPGLHRRNLTIKDGERSRPSGQSSPVSTDPCPRPPSAAEEGEFHAQIFNRLAEIQGERQGRWQKLMESFFGRTS